MSITFSQPQLRLQQPAALRQQSLQSVRLLTGLSLKSSVFSDVATAGKEEMGVEMVCTAQSSSKPTFAWERAGAEAGSGT